jgi:hypothetical protein
MSVDKELMDIDILLEGFTLSSLFLLREQIFKIRDILKDARTKNHASAIINVKIEKKSYFVRKNVEIIEHAMVIKESEIFYLTKYSDYCLN